MGTLDTLIGDVAADHGVGGRMLLLGDPSGDLGCHGLDLLDQGILTQLWIAGAEYRPATQFLEQARAMGLGDAVRIAGLVCTPDAAPEPLDLAEFLANAAAPASTSADGAHQVPTVVLGHLPKSLARLDLWTRSLARIGAPLVVLGGNTKHMTRTQNQVLERGYHQVQASLGKGRFRCLVAERPRDQVDPAVPLSRQTPSGRLSAVGGVFGGAELDAGGQLLVDAILQAIPDEPATALDLGCGNGQVALALLEHRRHLQVVATDTDPDAIASARLTLADHLASGRASVLWDDAASTLPDASLDLVALNPPFHAGTRIDPTLVRPLLEAATRLLRPGGTLWLVHNSHLRYRPLLERRFAEVCQRSRDRRFTVLSAVRME